METKYPFNDEYFIPRHLRKLRCNWKQVAGVSVSAILVAIAFAGKMHFLPEFSRKSLELILEWLSLDGSVGITSSGLWKYTSFLQMSVKYPGKTACIIIAIISLVTMIVITRIKFIPKPATILLNLLISPLASFAILFIFLPSWFSFNPDGMSDLVTTVSSLIVLGMPLLMWLFLAPVPISPWKRVMYIASFDILICILYFLKHIILIFIYRYTNALVIPYIELLILSLWDIIWMNTFYSLIMAGASKRANKNSKLWSKI